MRTFAIWAPGAVVLFLLAPAAHAGANSLKLSGHVQPRASVWLSNWSISSINLQAATQRLKLTDLLISANNKHFSVSVLSENADAAGNPTLVDPETGTVLGYSVALAAASAGMQQAAGAQALEMTLPQARSQMTGNFQDRLTLVIKAR